MPTYRRGDLFEAVGQVDVLLVTTNACLNCRGELVMGAGSAADLKGRFPTMPKNLADRLKELNDGRPWRSDEVYGVVLSTIDEEQTLFGGFQTKAHWEEPASLRIIGIALDTLKDLCEGWYLMEERFVPPVKIAMPFPGIGFGGLSKEDVAPLLDPLPETVIVYEQTWNMLGTKRRPRPPTLYHGRR